MFSGATVLTVQIAFASNPIGGSYTWVDVSDHVRTVKIKRGRQHVLNRFEPGSCTILFNGRDGKLDPTNTASPYYPNVDINRRVRVLAGASATPIFTGFTDAWTPKWPNKMSSDIEMTATDGMRMLSKAGFTTSQYIAQVTADGAQNIVPLSDDSTGLFNNGLYVTDLLNLGTPNLWAAYYPVFVSVPGPSYVDTSTAMTFSGGQVLGRWQGAGAPWSTIQSTSDFSLEVWANWTSSTSNQAIVGQYNLTGASLLCVATDTAGTLKIWVDEKFGSGFAASSSATALAYNDGQWHHIVLSCSTGSTPTYTLYVDGVSVANISRPRTMASQGAWGNGSFSLISCSCANPDFTVDTGLPLWAHGFYGTLANLAAYSTGKSLSAAQALQHYALGLTGFVVEDTGARITRALVDAGWPAADESIQTGQTMVQTPSASLYSTSVLSYMQQIEDAEHGSLFASAAGLITFQSRYASLGLTSIATLGDAAGEIPYKPGPTFGLDNIDLYNASRVQRLGGALQLASDTASITKYGMTSVLNESGLLTTSDADSLARAQWNVSHYKTPLPRMQSLTVDVLGDVPNRFTQIALRELRESVTVKRRPYATPAGFPATQFSQANLIEGIEHSIDGDRGTWEVTLRLSPAETKQYWILGDATYGVLDSTTALAY